MTRPTDAEIAPRFARTVNAAVMATVYRVTPFPAGLGAAEWCPWCAVVVKRAGRGRPNVAGQSHSDSAAHHANLIRWHDALEAASAPEKCYENKHFIAPDASHCQCGENARQGAASAEPFAAKRDAMNVAATEVLMNNHSDMMATAPLGTMAGEVVDAVLRAAGVEGK